MSASNYAVIDTQAGHEIRDGDTVIAIVPHGQPTAPRRALADLFLSALNSVTSPSDVLTTKVVIVVEGGAVQNILADGTSVDVLVKDYDIEGTEPNQTAMDDEGARFFPIEGPHRVDVESVSACYRQVDAFNDAREAADSANPPRHRVP